MEGSIETARESDELECAEDIQIDQKVGELGKYGIVMAALHETNSLGMESTNLVEV